MLKNYQVIAGRDECDEFGIEPVRSFKQINQGLRIKGSLDSIHVKEQIGCPIKAFLRTVASSFAAGEALGDAIVVGISGGQGRPRSSLSTTPSNCTETGVFSTLNGVSKSNCAEASCVLT